MDIGSIFRVSTPLSAGELAAFRPREDVAQRLRQVLASDGVAILYGPRGSGKTSLVHAALMPALQTDPDAPIDVLYADTWASPDGGLVGALGSALRHGQEPPSASEKAPAPWLFRSSDELASAIRSRGADPARTLLVIDEYDVPGRFGTGREPAEEMVFGAHAAYGLKLLFVVESQHLAETIASGPMSQLGPRSLVAMRPLTQEEVRALIEQPARASGLHMEEGLVDRLMHDMGPGPDPHRVNTMLHALWSRSRRDSVLSLQDYEALGGKLLLADDFRRRQARSASRSGEDELAARIDDGFQALSRELASLAALETERDKLEERRRQAHDRIASLRQDPLLNGPRVFICYAREDVESVKPLAERLLTEGISPWMDIRDLDPGTDWKLEIDHAMRRADFILLCLSSNAVSKQGFVQRELNDALDLAREVPEGRVFLIPVLLDECEMPSRLARLHHKNLYAPNGYEHLVQTLWRHWHPPRT